MNEQEFKKHLEELGIYISEDQTQKFNNYYNLLKEYNLKFNLTKIIEKKDVYLKHFYDSSTLIKAANFNNQEVCDVGTGAGFPGMVLKILFPNIKLTLIESSKKKADFLNQIIKTLELKDVNVICNRAEELAKITNEKYDIVTSRAVAKINILLEICSPLLKVGGICLFMKSNIEKEIEESADAFKLLYCKVNKTLEFILPFEKSKRTIVVIIKQQKTNKKFPRRFAEIKKNPL